ncbi:porin [Duganella phyllosphaerae]|uniref:Outer membrane porin protein 32 n=1 Tax=Duganella phyllosphaerae TaxID=762836 RepID=A0A1E7W946_9BURK|nr:porin [Duganella phyllosphaerae]OEZ92912.1 outer membrane porin protein 32 precursor [Duganella phyllosphaerae]
MHQVSSRTAIRLAIFALVSAAAASAQAQSSVQFYGLLDVGVESLNNAGPNGASTVKAISGGMNTSRWGFRGSEDLGNGLKAVYNLEGGILMDSGGQDGALFRRQSYVGLDGAFGRVIIGRSFTSVYDTVIAYDPMGFAPYYSWATSGPATGPSKYGFTTGYDNLVKYAVTVGNFRFGANYAFGEQANSTADSAKTGITGAYKLPIGGGTANFMATWERNNGNTVAATGNRDENTVWHVGANYETGPFKFWAVRRDYNLTAGSALTADVEATTTWGGVAYKPNPVTTITGAVYHIDVKNVAAGRDADPTMYVARYRYALSKRTDLHVSAAYAKAKNGQLTGLSRDDAGFANSQRGVTVGMQHRF